MKDYSRHDITFGQLPQIVHFESRPPVVPSPPEAPHVSQHTRPSHARFAMVPVSLDLARQLAMFGKIVRRSPDSRHITLTDQVIWAYQGNIIRTEPLSGPGQRRSTQVTTDLPGLMTNSFSS